MKRLISYIIFVFTILCAYPNGWVATWSCAPQRAGKNDITDGLSLSDCAVRQIIRVSIGGDKIRLRLSNQHSTEPLEIKSVVVANPGKRHYEIDSASATTLKFNGEKSVNIPWGVVAVSDEIDFHLDSLQRVVITINYGHVPQEPTIHSGSRTHSYIISGEADATTDFSEAISEVHWYSITGLDVATDSALRCIACLGNSITDGRGVTTDADNRWTDVLADCLDGQVAVLNLGIGGNCVLAGGLGPTAKERFSTDILAQSGVTDVIVFEGINDIGSDSSKAETAQQLIKAYRRFIKKAHEAGLKIYGATITPVKGSSYFSNDHEAIRQIVNQWLLNCNEFDGVFDISSVVANPADPAELLPEYQYDAIHPNPQGYRAIGEYIAKFFINHE